MLAILANNDFISAFIIINVIDIDDKRKKMPFSN